MRALAEIAPGAELLLKRDPLNKHDRRAIEVWSRGTMLGFIAAEDNRELAQKLDHDRQPQTKANFMRGPAGGSFAVLL